MLSPQDVGGVGKVLCPSNLLPRLRRSLRTPSARCLPSPALGGPVSPGLPLWHQRKASLPSSDSEEQALHRRAVVRGSLRGGCGSSCSSHSLSCSQPPSTCHFPPTLQPKPEPMADAGPGRRPSALCCRLSTPTPYDFPEGCGSSGPRTPTSPPPPCLNLRWDPSPGGPRGLLTEGETEAQERFVLGCKPVRG
ncbi:hypothetical protein HJG60_010929 [Phyllostomus discolor]|uniref:Uncharacterized protein n=1 Tax=Phyllostomus discolor TaxID=89673 RepID=A0A834ADS9_9CHIR|nr:hypothetical protein HJG60_010929 [Phyllostomus discolor]